jgi:hypothetical protein
MKNQCLNLHVFTPDLLTLSFAHFRATQRSTNSFASFARWARRPRRGGRASRRCPTTSRHFRSGRSARWHYPRRCPASTRSRSTFCNACSCTSRVSASAPRRHCSTRTLPVCRRTLTATCSGASIDTTPRRRDTGSSSGIRQLRRYDDDTARTNHQPSAHKKLRHILQPPQKMNFVSITVLISRLCLSLSDIWPQNARSGGAGGGVTSRCHPRKPW